MHPPPSEDAWAAVGPFLSVTEVRERLCASMAQLEAWVRTGTLIVLVERTGARRFPVWQFGADGRPLDALVRAHRVLVEQGGMSAWSAASWCVHEHPELGLSPREWAHGRRNPEQLALVASRDAGRAAR